MPLYKRKPFALVEKPKDLKPNELIFQVRYTKEIFQDYGEYLRRINLYRHRVWTCKSTGKNNLTYEEALVSEKKAAEKVQKFPEELVAPVLRDVQFSMLSLKDLGDAIAQKLQGSLSEGSELYGTKNNCVYPCKIVRVVKDSEKTLYKVVWLDKYEKLPECTVVSEEDFIKCELRFSRAFMRSFIRESTYRSIPWVLHEKLAKKHSVPTDPPDELKDQILIQDGVVVFNRKKKRSEDTENALEAKENGFHDPNEDDKLKEQSIKYPIDDLFVQHDKHLVDRPSPCREFNVPMECVGDLLMVWDFCSSFGKFLHLSPFSLEDFENALCHRGSNIVLISESHAALLRLLLGDNDDYFMAVMKKRQKMKISLINWMDFLSDFLELIGIAALSPHIATIKRGHYGLLDFEAKIAILNELVSRVIGTEHFKEKIDEEIEKKQALEATKREEVLEESRKRRQEEEHLKMQSNEKEATGNDDHLTENGKRTSLEKCSPENSDNELLVSSLKNAKKRKVDVKDVTEEVNDSRSKSPSDKLIKDEGKETLENKSKDQRAVHRMRKNEIKEHLGNRNKEQRKEYLEQEIEKRVIRSNPLGMDRDYNRYWFFRRDGRIFVESSDSAQWGFYSSKEELDALIGSLNVKGIRERDLKKELERLYHKISSELQKRSNDVGRKEELDEAVVRRSTRVRAPPRENPALAYLKYENRWRRGLT